MVLRLDDKVALTMPLLKRRWAEAEKSDPFHIVSGLLKGNKYNELAAILLQKDGAAVRELLAVPAALVLVSGLDYCRLVSEMEKRNAGAEFYSCARVALRIANEKGYEIPAKPLEQLLHKQDYPAVRSIPQDYAEYLRMYDIYCEQPR